MAEVIINFAKHPDEADWRTYSFLNTLDEVLATTDGRVGVFSEFANSDHEFVLGFDNLSQRGYSPTFALIAASLPDEQVGWLVGEDIHNRRLAYDQIEFASEAEKARFMGLDRLHAQYRTKDGDPRIFCYYEPASLDEDWTQQLESEWKSALMEGDFASALTEFKRFASFFGELQTRRETSIAKKIQLVMERDDLDYLLVRFGSMHTGIYHMLKTKRGFTVTRSLLEKDPESGIELYDPFSAIVRKIMFRGEHSLTESDWQMGMLATISFETLQLLYKNSDKDDWADVENEYIASTNKFARIFRDPDNVMRFEGMVKEKGFIDALQAIANE